MLGSGLSLRLWSVIVGGFDWVWSDLGLEKEMASLPLSRKAKPIRSTKTPQSLPCSRTAVASFTPLSLLSFSASGTSAVSGPISITAPMSLSVFSIPKSGQSSVAFSIGISVWFCLSGMELVGGCWVYCCCWSDRWSYLDIWGLGFAGDLVLAFAGNFAFWNFFLFFKLLTCCGIRNFFDYGLVWE